MTSITSWNDGAWRDGGKKMIAAVCDDSYPQNQMLNVRDVEKTLKQNQTSPKPNIIGYPHVPTFLEHLRTMVISREYMQRMSIWKEYGHQEMDFEPRAQEVSPFETILLRMQAVHSMKHALTIFQTFPHVYFWHDGWSESLVAGFTFFARQDSRDFANCLGVWPREFFTCKSPGSWQHRSQNHPLFDTIH